MAECSFGTGTAVSGGQLDFRILDSTAFVLERPSPAAGWIFVLWWYIFGTGTAVRGGRPDFHILVVPVKYWNDHFRRPAGFSLSICYSYSTALVVLELLCPADVLSIEYPRCHCLFTLIVLQAK